MYRSKTNSRLLLSAAVFVLLGACANKPQSNGTGSGYSFSQSGQNGVIDWQARVDQLGTAYDRRPGEKEVSLAYAQALKKTGQHGQAVAVLQKATLSNGASVEIAAAYGKALADIGRFSEASEVLAGAHQPDRPDWRVLSAQGTVADQLGQHERAREFYANALKINPGEPTVLSNLGLSLALSRRLPEAEATLRQAAQRSNNDPRVLANLALVESLKSAPKQVNQQQIARRDMLKRAQQAAHDAAPSAPANMPASLKAPSASRAMKRLTVAANPALIPPEPQTYTDSWAEIEKAEQNLKSKAGKDVPKEAAKELPRQVMPELR